MNTSMILHSDKVEGSRLMLDGQGNELARVSDLAKNLGYADKRKLIELLRKNPTIPVIWNNAPLGAKRGRLRWWLCSELARGLPSG